MTDPHSPALSRRAMLGAGAALVCAFSGSPAGAQSTQPGQRAPRNRAAGETPSGLPVPRFVSLKRDEVFGRAGPDGEYPVVTVYRQRGLPVRVIAETETWRRVEDPFGRRVWIAHFMLAGRQTGMVLDQRGLTVPLRRRPDMEARQLVSLQPGVVVRIKESRPGWRRVEIDRYRGWLPADSLWGP